MIKRIIRSGFNVYPAEVEGAIASHPAVLHAAVVGEPAGLGDETVIAYVQLREAKGSQEAIGKAIEAHVRATLAPYMWPPARTCRFSAGSKLLMGSEAGKSGQAGSRGREFGDASDLDLIF